MKKLLVIAGLLIATCGYSQTEWQLDKAHSRIRFSATHMLISEVGGKFNEFDGSVLSTNDDFSGSTVNFVAKVASLDTDNERRDTHLKSDDFFNAEAYPDIKFQGKIEKEGDNYFLVGTFTMREITRDIKFDVKYNGQVPGGRGRKAGFKITGVVNRFDYGLKWNRALEAGGLVVSEEIEITCTLELNEVVVENK